MKHKLTIFMALTVLIFASCEDLIVVPFDANLRKSIKINVDESISDLKSTVNPFAQVDTLDLEDNEDVEKYIDQLKSCEVNYITVQIIGIPNGEMVSDFTLELPQVGFSYTIDEISENLLEFKTDSTYSESLAAIGSYLLSKKKVIIEVSGYSTYAPLVLTAEVKFNTSFEASAL